jgi:hypothetical protein
MSKFSAVKRELGDFDREGLNKTELHALLKDIDNDRKVDELFKEISGLDIEKVWREQKEFVLLKQIYIAATTYGEGSSACIQGTWSQIINSINEISTEILAQYDDYLQEEQKLEAQKNVITEENIKPFIEDLANKLIEYVELHPELKDTLEDFAVNIVDIDEPEEITCEQQKILAEINKYFSKNIRDFLPNYNENIPNRDEYYIIINGLLEVEVMQNFAQGGQGQYGIEEILLKNGTVGNNEHTTPHDNVQIDNTKAKSIQLNNPVNKSTSTISDQLQTLTQEHAIFSDDEYEQDDQLNLSSSMNSISGNQSNPISSQSSNPKGDEERSETTLKNQSSFGNGGSNSAPYFSEDRSLLKVSASDNKQGVESEVLLSKSESEDDKSDITVILADTKKEKHPPIQPAEQADSITRESTQPKPVTNEQDISTKDNSKSKPKENNVTSQNKKMYILVTSALVVAGIVSGIAIAVYSGMLAVGIAVGICCLIAAAVIYRCNNPSNLLKDSNAEVTMNQGQEL